MKSGRPKKAYGRYSDTMRFMSNYRDVATRADAALEQAQTQVAIVPLRSSTGNRQMGRDVAAAWNGALVEKLAGGETFTHILPAEDVERQLRLSDLGRTSRADAIRIGKKAGADRVVWGSIGAVQAKNSVEFFTHNVWHHVPARDESGRTVMRWVEVPFPVVARTRTVQADLAYEVISTRGGTTLARESGPRTLEARALWTAFVPEGAADTYMLVSEEIRRSDPDRCRQIEAEWANVVGASTTLSQVIEARRALREPAARAPGGARPLRRGRAVRGHRGAAEHRGARAGVAVLGVACGPQVAAGARRGRRRRPGPGLGHRDAVDTREGLDRQSRARRHAAGGLAL